MRTTTRGAGLFDPCTIGELVLGNRVAMAPMTRARCHDCVAVEDTALYYAQRAEAGLLVSEGVPVSPEARGYVHLPGIWTPEQVDGWRGVTEAVHAASGRIFAQLWHVGRVSHHSLQPGGAAPISASGLLARGVSAFAMQEDGTAG